MVAIPLVVTYQEGDIEQSLERRKEVDSRREKANANFIDESVSDLFKEQQPHCKLEATSIPSKIYGLERPGWKRSPWVAGEVRGFCCCTSLSLSTSRLLMVPDKTPRGLSQCWRDLPGICL